MEYEKPKVTIDLAEYNALLYIVKFNESDPYRKAVETFISRMLDKKGNENNPIWVELSESCKINGISVIPTNNGFKLVPKEPQQ